MRSAEYLKALLLDPASRPLSREEFDQLKRQNLPVADYDMERRRALYAPAPVALHRPDPRAALLEPDRLGIDDGPVPAPPGPARSHHGPYVVRDASAEGGGIIRTLGETAGLGWENPVATRRLRVCVSSITVGQLSGTVEPVPEPFATDDQPWSWVIFDFLENSVRPSRYSLAHPPSVSGYMRFWQVEGSNDNIRWDTLSRHNQDLSLDQRRLAFGWDLCPQKFYRYIRVVLDPRGNSAGTSTLALTSFELYGEVSSPPAAEEAGGGAGEPDGRDAIPRGGGRVLDDPEPSGEGRRDPPGGRRPLRLTRRRDPEARHEEEVGDPREGGDHRRRREDGGSEAERERHGDHRHRRRE